MVKIDDKIWQHKNELTDGSQKSLSDVCKDKLVLFFYPRANTPGCTNESKDFSLYSESFRAAGCEILGVSMDSLKKQQNFKSKYAMNFELVADTDEVLCQAFDVIKEKKMYGKTFMGIERSTFVLGKNGEILQAWRKVKVPGHAESVLTHVKTI